MRGGRKTGPEDRGSLKSVSPGAPMGFIPSADMGGTCSGSLPPGPFDEAMAALGPDVSWRCLKLLHSSFTKEQENGAEPLTATPLWL